LFKDLIQLIGGFRILIGPVYVEFNSLFYKYVKLLGFLYKHSIISVLMTQDFYVANAAYVYMRVSGSCYDYGTSYRD
jgi:hypothetical protein